MAAPIFCAFYRYFSASWAGPRSLAEQRKDALSRWSALDTGNDIFTLSGSTFAVYLYLVCRKNGHSSSDRLFCPCWFSPTASFQLRNKPVDSSFCVVTGWVQALLHKN